MTDTTTGASADAIELLISDHREVEQLFKMMDGARTTGDVDQQRYVAEHVVEDLSVDAVIEEEILYPTIREALPDGDQLADEALQEHQEVKELLTRIDGKDPQSEDARAAFDELTPTSGTTCRRRRTSSFPAPAPRWDRTAWRRWERSWASPARRRPLTPIPTPPTRRPAMWPLERLRPWSTRSATKLRS